jgi:adenine-specific DNA-methyltransferase
MTSPIDRLDLKSLNIADVQQQKLKMLFPEVFTEGGKIDFDRLKRTLGDIVDAGKERFGMSWAGKSDCFKTIQQPSIATLVPARHESIDFDTTQNVFIEGDNLEVLKLLQKSYLGKVKMIYIDPPYNTGNDFIYPDNYNEHLNTYLEYTGQIDGEGRKFSTNVDTDGRFHSKWMNMMYPRLFLAKNLLREDGVIFISIDDNEVHHLRALCNEVFGEENFVAVFMWKRKKEISSDSKDVALQGEYIICYSKSILVNLKSEPLSKDYIEKSYYEPNNEFPLGKWRPVPITVSKGLSGGGYDYEITTPSSKKHNKTWAYPQDSYLKLLKSGKVYFGKNNDAIPQKVIYAHESSGQPVTNYWEDVATNKQGKKEIISIFGDNFFDTPKPILLVKKILNISTDVNDIVLDFFAGSATTAHAVMALNKEDGGNRKFICVQLPEPCDEKSEAHKQGYQTIAEISKERIRRAAAKIKTEQAESHAKPDLFDEGKTNTVLDLGFRVFKLQKSNFKVWDASTPKDAEAIQQALELHVDHIDPSACQEAILFELLLKSGFELTTPIKKLTLANKEVYSIADDALLICLDKALTSEVIREMAERNPVRVICLDEGFQDNDQLKTNAVLIMKSKGVNDFRTV